MRSGQANHSGNLPPDRAAQGQTPKETSDKYRKSTAAHPVRQRDLGRDVEACQDSDPGCSATTLPANAVGASRANANRTIANAVPRVPTATRRSGPSLAFNHGNPKAAPTAAAPIAPRR